MAERDLPEAPENAFVVPVGDMPRPPSDEAPPPPPPTNVFVAAAGDIEEVSNRENRHQEELVEYHEGDSDALAAHGEAEHHSDSRAEGVAVLEAVLGPVMEADEIEELPVCLRAAQAAVSGSGFQLYAIEEELQRTRAASQRQLQKEQHSKVDMNKINDGAVLPVTASQVLLVRHEAALARRQLPPPNLPPVLMEELPCGSTARAMATYKETKKMACEHGHSYVDHDFPRKTRVTHGEEERWEWRSAAKERPDACFLGDEGIDGGCIVPGKASGRGFLAAVAALSVASRGRSKHLLEKVMPSKASQGHLSKNAEAIRENITPEPLIFRFSFFKWGRWVDVMVDDRLPVTLNADGEHQFQCARLSSPCQFGLSLLEKAYAKLHGSYAATQCISFFDALRDLTGAIVDISWDLREISSQGSTYKAGDQYYDPEELWCRLQSLPSDDTVMVITGGDERPAAAQAGGVEELGLLPHTAYPVQARETVKVNSAPGVTSGVDHLLFLDNKTGQSPVWTGAWSSRAGQWSAVSKGAAKGLKKVAGKYPNGFWMSWKDVINSGSLLLFLRKEKSSHCFFGEWLPSSAVPPDGKLSPSAGGHTAHVTWHRNPQYLLTVKSPGDVLISVMQQEPLLFTSGTGQGGGVSGALRIGFSLFGPVEDNRTTKLHHLLGIQRPTLYRNEVEVAECCQISAPGKFILTVTTWEPEERGKYCLRIQSATGSCLASCKELTLDVPPKKTFGGGHVRAALAVRLVSATGLKKRMLHSVHAYAEVTVDGVSKKTAPDKAGGRNPTWDERFLFFLRKSSPTKPPTDAASTPVLSKTSTKLKIEIWDCNMLIDTFLGVCHIGLYDIAVAAARDWPGPTRTHSVLLNLEQRKSDKEDGNTVTGSVLFEYCYFLLPDFA